LYTEPVEDDVDADLPEVADWKKARLALPGVEVGESLHVALVLAPDLERAIRRRKETDRRTDLLNEQAAPRWQREWDRYDDLMAARAAKPRGGRQPKQPPAQLVVRKPQLPVTARTEELFATGIAMVLGYAQDHGLQIGPNRWPAFIRRGREQTGYRRSAENQPHQRNVPNIGSLVDLADAIAQLGPIDKRTGKPIGDRFRALILLHLMGLRPSEMDALDPGDFTPATRSLHIAPSAASVHRLATEDGSTISIRDGVKGKELGSARRIDGMPAYIADAVIEHRERGYSSDTRLFTGPEGEHLRWGNVIPVYWRPAVDQVFGHAHAPILREMPRRWLRKAAVTWMLRIRDAGRARRQDHRPPRITLYTHYTRVVADSDIAPRTWSGWDAAWDWASREHHVS
jgi:hypothetical protein